MKSTVGLLLLLRSSNSGLRFVRISVCWMVIASKGRRNCFYERSSLRCYYLLCISRRLLMPRQSQATSSMIRGTKALYFAEVCQYRARATIHPIKGITGVWLPMGLQKLPNRQLRYSKHDLHTQLLDCCYSLTSTFCAHSGYAGSTGTSQVSSGPVEAISSTLFCKVIQQHWQSVIKKYHRQMI